MEGARFGEALHADQGLAVVGAPRVRGSSTREGAAWVGELRAGTWTALARLDAPQPGAGERLGAAVAVGRGGEWIALGAPFGAGSAGHSGVVRVFRRQGQGHLHDADLCPAGTPNLSAYGSRLAADGDRLAVGAPLRAAGAAVQVGSVDLHERRPGGWVHLGTFPAPDGRPAGRFGEALDLLGPVLVVGAPEHDGRGPASGTVWVHDLAHPALPAQRLDPGPGPTRARFGAAVALSPARLAVGAPGPDAGPLQPGSVSLFVRDASNWRLERTLEAPVGTLRFGAALAWRGEELWVGAPGSRAGSGALARWIPGRGELELVATGAAGEGLGSVLAADGEGILAGLPEDERDGPGRPGGIECDVGGLRVLRPAPVPEPACDGPGVLEVEGCGRDEDGRPLLQVRVLGLVPGEACWLRAGRPGPGDPFLALPADHPACGLARPSPGPTGLGTVDATGCARLTLGGPEWWTLLLALDPGGTLGLEVWARGAGPPQRVLAARLRLDP